MKELEEEMRQDWQGALGSCQRSLEADICIKLYEGFYKKKSPQIIHFHGLLHHKSSILGTPIDGTPHMGLSNFWADPMCHRD